MAVARALAALLLLAVVAACVSSPLEPAPDAGLQTERVLRSHENKAALSHFVGTLPAQCIESSWGTELCEWQAGNDLPGWRDMAAAIDTGDRVNLICELPLSDAPRAAGSCTIHPRRSNRYSWQVPPRGAGANRQRKEREIAEARAQNLARASQWMRDATTLAGMSRLMGSLPETCLPPARDEIQCLWRASDVTFGHGTLAVWIDAPVSKKIRLTCAFPVNGAPRRDGSCGAVVGD